MQILVVDDEPAVRDSLERALRLEGYEIALAADGRQALARLQQDGTDAVVLDVMMPGVDGPSTVAALRADPATRDIPIIFLTAKMPSEHQDEWRALNLAGVIPKPFDPMTLATDMAALLGWAEAPT